MTTKWVEYHSTTTVMTADVTPAAITFFALYKAQEYWIDAVQWYEGDYVPTVLKSNRAATNPVPNDKATDVIRDVTLSWKAGPYAATHNVYFGTSFADVNAADTTKPQLVSQGQTGVTYKVPALLEYGKTYYWRVDEVNAAPSTAVAKGLVWSFTVEPYAYPITNVTATASSTQPSASAQNTANGSGLDANGLHGIDGTTMWLSQATPSPNWIQYQFDNVYKLDKMLVWNYNQLVETIMGFGAKDVKVEYSTDGATWTALANVPQFARAPGLDGYAANTTVNFAGAMAKYVKLTINSNWGGLTPYAGLSEVQFSYVPTQVRAPQPAPSATGVSVTAGLDWRPGRDVTAQKVYLGTDKTAVTNGTIAAATVADHGFTPASLSFGTTYYWRVDEVGAATTYPGPVWSFTTVEFAVVDDFESYNDTNNTIYDAWIDGLTDSKSGSTVGYMQAPFAEQTIVHGGKQSMPIAYDNSKAPFYSETTRDLGTAQDWTGNGATHMDLWYLGYPAPTTFAVTMNGSVMSVTGDGTDIWNNSDDFAFAYKTFTGDGSIVARVVSVGTGTNTWAKGGVMIRSSLNGGAMDAYMTITAGGGNGASFQQRTTTNGNPGNADAAAVITPPYWVKVTRTGTTFAGYMSADGKTWTQQGTSQAITMADPVYIGICECSHQAGEQRTMQFDNITITGNVTGSWQGAYINSPQYNAAAGMYVAVTDSSGKSKLEVNADPAAANTAAWTQWKIPLSDLTAAGVKTTKIQKITIGVGNKTTPAAGGTGTVYIDDIGFGHSVN
jgi:hypothetical protein